MLNLRIHLRICYRNFLQTYFRLVCMCKLFLLTSASAFPFWSTSIDIDELYDSYVGCNLKIFHIEEIVNVFVRASEVNYKEKNQKQIINWWKSQTPKTWIVDYFLNNIEISNDWNYKVFWTCVHISIRWKKFCIFLS